MLIELHIALFTDTYNMMFSSYDMNIICNEYKKHANKKLN